MVPDKVIYEGPVQYEPGRDPLTLLWTITLPVNQVLPAPTPGAHSQQPLDLVDRAPIYYFRRRRGRGGRDHGTVFDRFDLAYVERGMDTERPGETKTNCCRTNNLSDGERPHETWCQFP